MSEEQQRWLDALAGQPAGDDADAREAGAVRDYFRQRHDEELHPGVDPQDELRMLNHLRARGAFDAPPAARPAAGWAARLLAGLRRPLRPAAWAGALTLAMLTVLIVQTPELRHAALPQRDTLPSVQGNSAHPAAAAAPPPAAAIVASPAATPVAPPSSRVSPTPAGQPEPQRSAAAPVASTDQAALAGATSAPAAEAAPAKFAAESVAPPAGPPSAARALAPPAAPALAATARMRAPLPLPTLAVPVSALFEGAGSTLSAAGRARLEAFIAQAAAGAPASAEVLLSARPAQTVTTVAEREAQMAQVKVWLEAVRSHLLTLGVQVSTTIAPSAVLLEGIDDREARSEPEALIVLRIAPAR